MNQHPLQWQKFLDFPCKKFQKFSFSFDWKGEITNARYQMRWRNRNFNYSLMKSEENSFCVTSNHSKNRASISETYDSSPFARSFALCNANIGIYVKVQYSISSVLPVSLHFNSIRLFKYFHLFSSFFPNVLSQNRSLFRCGSFIRETTFKSRTNGC